MKGIFAVEEVSQTSGLGPFFVGRLRRGKLVRGMELRQNGLILTILALYRTESSEQPVSVATKGEQMLLTINGAKMSFLETLQGQNVEFTDTKMAAAKKLVLKPELA